VVNFIIKTCGSQTLNRLHRKKYFRIAKSNSPTVTQMGCERNKNKERKDNQSCPNLFN
jgi:hypothetical protein